MARRFLRYRPPDGVLEPLHWREHQTRLAQARRQVLLTTLETALALASLVIGVSTAGVAIAEPSDA